MASISADGAKGHHKFTLNVTQSATNVANNTSTLSFEFKLSPIRTSWNWAEWGQDISYTITINGTNYTGYIPDYDGYSVVTLKSGTQSVTHNADGTKSISFSFSVSDGANQRYTSGNASASGSMTLTTIPRATTPTFSAKSVTMGNSITITMTPAASTFKHKLRYSWSTLAPQPSGFSVGSDFTAQGTTTATFTPPTFLANYIPNSTSGTCAVLCYTFDANGNHIGTVSTDITLAVPSYTPSGSITITGNNLLSGAYVQGKSTMGVSISASTSYGATITGYSSVVDGKTYSGNSFTTSALSNGSKSVVTTITDSRGKTAQITSSSVTVYEYAAPKITSFTLARQSDGTTVVATVKGSISAVNNKNAKTIKVTLYDIENTITSSAYTINGTTTFTNVPTDVTLIGSATITDSYTTAKQDSVLPTVAVTMDFHHSGKGIGMGKVAEHENMLDVAWNIRNHSIPTLLGGMGKKIQENADLNTSEYITPNNYVCPLNNTAKTLKNSPTSIAFKMEASNCLGDFTDVGLETYCYLTRKITDYNNNIWIQFVRKEGGSWMFGEWSLVLNTDVCRDYVVEQGTSGIWTYRKWNSGVAECWGIHTMTSAATKTWGTLYYSDTLTPRLNYPFTFTSRPQENVFLRGSSVAGWVYAEAGGIGLNTTAQTGQYGFVRPTTIASSEVKYEFTVVGKWK